MSEETERTDEAYLHWKEESEKREREGKYISKRWEQLYHLEEQWGKEAIKYLMFLNSGGAVATLSFVGALGPENVGWQAKAALGLFAAGIILAGTLVAFAYLSCSALFAGWTSDYKKYLNEDLTYEQMDQRDEERIPDPEIEKNLGIGSFILFILGIGIGAFGLFNSSTPKDAPVEHVSQSAPASTDSIDILVAK
ncbi:hypothetical protein QEH52_05790 [Coraliomargarita sp. SDUM461003]|uniref:Uncharacterized protein n=1 Tax=Thalassobacterium maritimum TaxID=3041265 RepID=A0ABU1AUT7_9BACT|nr:hypothetical protein [Coraliomargarita sp. SDUM461003]MDQ8207009.1 hypothetical protein [Coraliomargarita sp. SDUM461003]